MVGTVIAKIAGSTLGDTYTFPAADGASGEFLKTDGSTNLSFGSAAAGLNRQVVYTAGSGAGGYSPEAGVTKLIVIVQGGGGGGNRHDSGNNYRHGGASGGYVMGFISPVTSSETMTVIVGSAGAGATSDNGGGGSGTVSSFASVTGTSFTTLSGGGGTGGGTVSDVSPAGGTATGGDLRVVGQTTTAWQGNSAPGSGESLLGHGGSNNEVANTTYPNGTGYGAGGAWSNGVTAGDGSPGIVIIQEYK